MHDVDNKDLRYATNQSGTWSSIALDATGTVGATPSLAVDSAGKVHIAYRDTT